MARPTEKSRKVSAKVVTPRLSILSFPLSSSVFILFSPLLSSLCSGSNDGTVRALFSIFFHPSSAAHSLRCGKVLAQEDNFFLLYYSTYARRYALRYFSFLSCCYISIRGKCVKASVVSITYYTLLQNIEHYYRNDSRRKRTVV